MIEIKGNNSLYKYDPEILLGEGSFSKVYKGIDQNNQLEVAIRVSASFTNREIQILEFLIEKGPIHNVVRILDLFKILNCGQKQLVVVMEKANGNFKEYWRKNKVSIDQSVRILICYQIIRAISDLHSIGIMHRDIKPDNLLYFNKSKNKSLQLKICDFGESRMINDTRELTQQSGTFYYMAPEVFFGTNYNECIDVWSAGIMLFEILSNQKFNKYEQSINGEYFECKQEEINEKIQQSKIAKSLRNLINKTLNKNFQCRSDIFLILKEFQRMNFSCLSEQQIFFKDKLKLPNHQLIFKTNYRVYNISCKKSEFLISSNEQVSEKKDQQIIQIAIIKIKTTKNIRLLIETIHFKILIRLFNSQQQMIKIYNLQFFNQIGAICNNFGRTMKNSQTNG